MSYETLETKKEEAEPMDLVSKELFESGIQQLELSIHAIESNLVIANSMLQQAELLEKRELKAQIEESINKDREVLKQAKQQLVDLYLDIANTLDRKLLGALKEHVIRGENGLDPDDKVKVLNQINTNRNR